MEGLFNENGPYALPENNGRVRESAAALRRPCDAALAASRVPAQMPYHSQ